MAEHEKKEIDEISGTETTGHEWDGIKELNTPLPRWWVWTFYGTIVWAIGYTIAYPAWPLLSDYTRGLLGYSTRLELERELAERDARWKPYLDKIAALDVAEVASDAELGAFARASGAATFRTYCSQCHGSGATGAPGYPNLQDDDWLWGGTYEDILYTVTHGIRDPLDEDTRTSEMPAFGRDEILTPEEIEAVADYVLSLSGRGTGSEEGRQIYLDNCAACHGENGEGMREVGAPRLDDQIWLKVSDRESIIDFIREPRMGVMPAWKTRLDEARLKSVAIYVHDLGGGE